MRNTQITLRILMTSLFLWLGLLALPATGQVTLHWTQCDPMAYHASRHCVSRPEPYVAGTAAQSKTADPKTPSVSAQGGVSPHVPMIIRYHQQVSTLLIVCGIAGLIFGAILSGVYGMSGGFMAGLFLLFAGFVGSLVSTESAATYTHQTHTPAQTHSLCPKNSGSTHNAAPSPTERSITSNKKWSNC